LPSAARVISLPASRCLRPPRRRDLLADRKRQAQRSQSAALIQPTYSPASLITRCDASPNSCPGNWQPLDATRMLDPLTSGWL
jgi:hypothetical protein